jgi:uncharacterized membrane protein YkvA (DUF1232 family)
MMSRLRSAKRLLVDLPRQLRLAYCLMFDDRVPRYTKVAFGGALAVIALPIVDLPAAIPVVGELDVIALSLLAVRLFIAACPRYVVEDQERLIVERRSRFDDDLRAGERTAVMLYKRFRGEDEDDIALSGSAAVSETTHEVERGAPL